MEPVYNRYILPSFVERTSYGIKESNPYNKMFEERIIFLGVQIDDASANDVMAQLMVLESTDPDRDGRHYVDYLVHFDAGQRRFISLESVGDWDPMVEILSASEREGDAVDQDDDSGVDLNSLLAFQPGEAGDYIVRVTSFGEGTTGTYRLWVSQ